MTTKQVLVAHLRDRHPRLTLHGKSEAELQGLHSQDHHRYSVNHFHEGANLGPDERPPGWKTGADVRERR